MWVWVSKWYGGYAVAVEEMAVGPGTGRLGKTGSFGTKMAG